jgi:hypothetical protein
MGPSLLMISVTMNSSSRAQLPGEKLRGREKPTRSTIKARRGRTEVLSGGRPQQWGQPSLDAGEVCRITSLSSYDNPTNAVREHGTDGATRQSRRLRTADGFAV